MTILAIKIPMIRTMSQILTTRAMRNKMRIWIRGIDMGDKVFFWATWAAGVICGTAFGMAIFLWAMP